MLRDMLQRLTDAGVDTVVLTFNSNHTGTIPPGVPIIVHLTPDFRPFSAWFWMITVKWLAVRKALGPAPGCGLLALVHFKQNSKCE